ncbi:MAG: NADH-quinone oxidoreductase subunit N [Firmicutes bacterium]|nr:NADH-quinone oxidoreductase subunit N [Bacillota bacterium]
MWRVVLPELVVTATALVALMGDLFLPAGRKRAVGYLSLAGVVLALAAAVGLAATGAATPGGAGPAPDGPLAGMIEADFFALALKVVFVAVGLGVVLLGVDFAETRGLPRGEFFSLTLFAVLGMMLMAGSRDLVIIYLGLETTAISSYALAGLLRGDQRSGEAALKYFLTGALASAVILFGMALVFGAAGSTNLGALLGPGGLGGLRAGWTPVAVTGLVLLVAGFGFKVAAVPFHFWAPDAYEGAPTPVTAFFSVGPKAAAFAAVLRIFGPVLVAGVPGGAGGVLGEAFSGLLPMLFAVLSVVTMTVGNLAALAQTNMKRLLAYSSIAHAGYILVGLAVASPRGLAAVVYYLAAYAAMNLGAFAVVIWLENRGTGQEVDDYVGLARRAPLAALALVVCFLSLIGIPPTAGFFGKLYLFLAAVGEGQTWLAVVMVLNSAISVGYYYGVVRNMYLVKEAAAVGTESGTVGAIPGTPLVRTALGLAVVAVLLLGLLFEPLSRLATLAGGAL